MTPDQHPEAIIIHSSDLHLGTDDSFSQRDSLAVLPKVLSAAIEAQADIVVLAGDTFDNHRFSSAPRKFCAITAIPSLFCPAITTR
jgi:predicted MPP superfamily phosphohydrolase